MKPFRNSALLRVANKISSALIRLGVPLGKSVLLTVAGRRTGVPRSTPVTLLPTDQGWLLGAPYGPVDWVKNLRKAGEATVTRRGRQTHVVATELSPEEAAPQFRKVMAKAGPLLRAQLGPYFNTPVDAPLDAWQAEAVHHPMFRLEAVTFSSATKGETTL